MWDCRVLFLLHLARLTFHLSRTTRPALLSILNLFGHRRHIEDSNGNYIEFFRSFLERGQVSCPLSLALLPHAVIVEPFRQYRRLGF